VQGNLACAMSAGSSYPSIPASQLPIDPEWLLEFEAAERRPLARRVDCSFIRTPKPVIDDEPYRSFDTMSDYRRWCRENLPSWLGYD
jgi:hypothetical protein